MIKIPEDILTTEELENASGMKADQINIEIRNIVLEKQSLTLLVSVKLNFVMPKFAEVSMRERIVAKIGSVDQVRFKYVFETTNFTSPNGGLKNGSNRAKDAKLPMSGGVLYGGRITAEPIRIEEIYDHVGERGQFVIQGELFSLDSRTIKNGKLLVTMEITDQRRATCCKAFMKTEEFERFEDNVAVGDWIKVSGNVEFDTFENEVGIMARSINQAKKPERRDYH